MYVPFHENGGERLTVCDDTGPVETDDGIGKLLTPVKTTWKRNHE